MFAAKIVETVRAVIGDEPAALHEPLFVGNERKYVDDCLVKGWVAQGEYIERFEQMLCDFTGAKYAVATCNATCALMVASKLLYRPNGLIHLPPLTFVATANAVHSNDLEIKFTSSNGENLPVHLLGHRSTSLGVTAVLHDAAQALGSKLDIDFNDQYSSGDTEYLGETAVYSFNGNKIITTGGGGAIVTGDEELAEVCRHLITQARIPHSWEINHDDIGFNYRMPNINAALGCAQMESLPMILKAKRKLAKKYIKAFESIGVRPWKEPEGTKSNYWLNAIILDDPADQEATLQALHDAGYMARMLPTPLHMLEPYKNCPRDDLSASMDLWKRTICLPSSPKLGMKYV